MSRRRRFTDESEEEDEEEEEEEEEEEDVVSEEEEEENRHQGKESAVATQEVNKVSTSEKNEEAANNKERNAKKKDPVVVPRSGRFFLHDDRGEDHKKPPRRGRGSQQSGKKPQDLPWAHDKFDATIDDSNNKQRKERSGEGRRRRNRGPKDHMNENAAPGDNSIQLNGDKGRRNRQPREKELKSNVPSTVADHELPAPPSTNVAHVEHSTPKQSEHAPVKAKPTTLISRSQGAPKSSQSFNTPQKSQDVRTQHTTTSQSKLALQSSSQKEVKEEISFEASLIPKLSAAAPVFTPNTRTTSDGDVETAKDVTKAINQMPAADESSTAKANTLSEVNEKTDVAESKADDQLSKYPKPARNLDTTIQPQTQQQLPQQQYYRGGGYKGKKPHNKFRQNYDQAYSYDASGLPVQYMYDSSGNVISQYDPSYNVPYVADTGNYYGADGAWYPQSEQIPIQGTSPTPVSANSPGKGSRNSHNSSSQYYYNIPYNAASYMTASVDAYGQPIPVEYDPTTGLPFAVPPMQPPYYYSS